MLKDNMHLENFENQRVLKMHIIFILSTLILRELGLQKYFTLTPKICSHQVVDGVWVVLVVVVVVVQLVSLSVVCSVMETG